MVPNVETPEGETYCDLHIHDPSNGGGTDKATCYFKCNRGDLIVGILWAHDNDAKAVLETVECGGSDACSADKLCKAAFIAEAGGEGKCVGHTVEFWESGFLGYCKAVGSSSVCENLETVHAGLGEQCWDATDGENAGEGVAVPEAEVRNPVDPSNDAD